MSQNQNQVFRYAVFAALATLTTTLGLVLLHLATTTITL